MKTLRNIVAEFRPSRVNLRFGIITLVISTVVAVSVAGMFLDYRREYRQHIRLILASLKEQARAVRIARSMIQEPADFSRYVENFCAKTDDSLSPGHYVLVLDNAGAVISRGRHHSALDVERTLLTADSEDPILFLGGHRLAQVRLKDRDDATIILAQYMDRIDQILRAQLLSRGIVVAATATGIIALICMVINRWVIKPLTYLAAAAKQWAKREFVVRATLTGSAEFRFLAQEFNSMADQLQRYDREHISELEQAQKIQKNLLPISDPSVAGLRIATEYRPAKHVGGDLYDIFTLHEGRTAIVILDVCGHGISAALLTGVVKMALHRRLAEQDNLAKAIEFVNADLLACMPEGRFVTACVGIWDQSSQSWTYCAAGHPGGVLISDNRIRHLESTGPLLGVLAEMEWSSNMVTLSRGDRLFLYTDGVADAPLARGQEANFDLGDVLLNHSHMNLTEQLGVVLSNVIGHDEGEMADDVTMIGVEVTSAVDQKDSFQT